MSKQNKILIVVLVLILLVLAATTFYIRYQRANAIPDDTQRLFAGQEGVVTYTDINGNQASLEQYLGQVLVVTTWASWSPFTTADLTVLNEVVSKYERGQVAALAINRMETREQAERYTSTMPAFPNIVLIIDTADHFYKTVGGYAMPETLVFNAKGEVVQHIRGTINQAELETLLTTLIPPSN